MPEYDSFFFAFMLLTILAILSIYTLSNMFSRLWF